MSKLSYLVLCIIYALAPIAAQETWVDLESFDSPISKTDNDFFITFDDFPDNSIPDLEGLLSGTSDENTSDDRDDFTSKDSSEKDEADEIGTDIFGFPCAMVNGCVNIISGDFHESAIDFTLPGAMPFKLQRNYCGSGCKKHSLLYGWQLNHGAKLLAYKKDFYDYAIVKGSDRHGIRFKKYWAQDSSSCPPSFFKKNVTNCSFGEIKATTNFKNDRLHEGNLSFTLENAEGNFSFFEKSSHDPEHVSKTHGYRLENQDLPNGGSYNYRYSQWFGMPILIKQLNRKGDEIAGLRLEKDLNQREFQKIRELTYLTTTNEKLKYRFIVYGPEKDRRAVLREVTPPHSPAVNYFYEVVNGHLKQKRLYKRELPDNRILKIVYNHNGKVERLISPSGESNEMVATHTINYFKSMDDRSGKVRNGLGGIQEYHWKKSRKRLNALLTYDENDKVILRERYIWGDRENDQSHLSARILEQGNGELISFQKYSYDSYGNIKCFSHYGNLTGTNSSPITVESLSKCDVSKKHFQYDEKQRRIFEDDERIQNRYSYLEDTNLLATHYIIYEGRIQIRHAYRYDDSGAVCKKNTDNGSSENIYDLTDVTERKEKTSKNSSMGLPEIVREYALDLASGEKQLIRKTVNTYDAHGWMTAQSIYDCNKKLMYTLEWRHDSHGNVIYEKNALGNVTTSEYDANDNLIYEQKADIATRTLNYDSMNRLIKEEQKASHKDTLIKTYRYDVMGNCIASTDIYGKITRHEFDGHGRLLKTIHPSLNNTHSKPSINYTRNALGRAVTTTDGNGYMISNEYNVNGKPTFTAYPDGMSETNRYTIWGELAETIARDGTKIQYAYDPQGREIKKEWFDSKGISLKITSKIYNAFHLTSEKDGKDFKTHYKYDAAGRLASKRTKKRISTYFYDTLGRETKVSNSLGDGTFISYVKIYDALDQVIESHTLNPNGEITNRVVKRYDAQGSEVKSQEWNQAGKATTKTKYDKFGRVICVTNALGEATHTEYQIDGSLRKEVTDPLGVKKIIKYNVFDDILLEQRYDPMGKLVEQTEYRYDLNANKISRSITTDRKPVETIWRYDSMNQLTHTIEAVGTTDQKTVQHTYDSAGHLATLIKNDGTILTYTYDALGRKTSLKSSDQTVFYSYEYDDNDNLLSAKDEISGMFISCEYDRYDQLASETLPYGQKLSYAYDLVGHVKQVVLPDDTKIEYAYQGNTLRLITRTGALAYSHAYTEHDPSSNPTRICLPAQAGGLEINYDLLGRATMIKSSQWQENQNYEAHLLKERVSQDSFGKTVSSYSYDAKDQLLAENGAAEHTFEYDWQGNPVVFDGHSRKFSACNAIRKANGKHYDTDLNGNRTSDSAGNIYKYDALDRLIEVKTALGKYRYTYDASGRRTSRSHAGKTTYFLWQKQQEIGTISPNGIIEELQVLNPANRAVAFELQGSLYVPLHDALGHVRALLNSAGNCVATYRYSAFGEENLLGDILSPWRYSGKRMDVETGFVYFGKRYYDAKTLCWLTPDPIGDGDGPNYYAYVHNNPMLYSDPDGRFFQIAIPFTVEFIVITWGGAAATEAAVAVITYEAICAVAVTSLAVAAIHQTAQAAENAANGEGKRVHSPDQQAISDLVKGSGKKGVSNSDADTLLEWADEYDFPARDDRGKPQHWIGGEHIHIGPKHVPVYN